MKIPFRKLSIVLAVVVLLASIVTFQWLKKQKKPNEKKTPAPATKLIKTRPATNDNIRLQVPVYGKTIAKNRISILAEVSGILQPSSAKFRAGTAYRAGEVLLQIDPNEFALSLTAQRSALQNTLTQLLPDLKLDYPQAFDKWEQWLQAINPQQSLPDIPSTDTKQEKYFMTARGIFNQYYQIKSQEARLRKYTIRAPFGGIVTQSNVQPGMLVSPGQVLGEYIGTTTFELAANLNHSDLNLISTGDSALLRAEESTDSATGSVVRIGGQIDAQTQTVPVYIEIKNRRLREGMYLTGLIKTTKTTRGCRLKRSLLLEGNQVYVVVNNQLRLKTVTPISYQGSYVVVTGLNNTDVLMANRLPNAYEGMKVKTQ